MNIGNKPENFSSNWFLSPVETTNILTSHNIVTDISNYHHNFKLGVINSTDKNIM